MLFERALGTVKLGEVTRVEPLTMLAVSLQERVQLVFPLPVNKAGRTFTGAQRCWLPSLGFQPPEPEPWEMNVCSVRHPPPQWILQQPGPAETRSRSRLPTSSTHQFSHLREDSTSPVQARGGLGPGVPSSPVCHRCVQFFFYITMSLSCTKFTLKNPTIKLPK